MLLSARVSFIHVVGRCPRRYARHHPGEAGNKVIPSCPVLIGPMRWFGGLPPFAADGANLRVLGGCVVCRPERAAEEVATALFRDKQVWTFLDDCASCVILRESKCCTICWSESQESRCTRKNRGWNRTRIPLGDTEELRLEVWRHNGITVLGHTHEVGTPFIGEDGTLSHP